MAVEPFLRTRAQRGFMAIIILQAIVVLVLVGLVSTWFRQWVDFNTSKYKTILCYLTVIALAEIFELFMSLNALRARNIIQVVGIVAFHLAMISFTGVQVFQTKKALGTWGNCAYDGTVNSYVMCTGHGTLYQKVLPLLIAAPCVMGVSGIFMIWCGRELYAEFGWAIFHIVGANPAMKTMYRNYQIMLCLLKFDFFFFISVTIQLLIIVLSHQSVEYGLTVAAIPIVLILLVLAGYAVQREVKSIMVIALVLMLVSEAYFYKLVRIWDPSSRAAYVTTRTTLTVFTILAFLTLFATFLVGLRCFFDFDKGLLSSKSHGQSYTPVKTSDKADLTDVNSNQKYSSGLKTPGSPQEKMPSYQGGASVATRLSIE